ncbi:30S ribosomal protein S1 [Vagococcus coleopterorum]|uniref:30S ribosomal protein S1 n=1 Tax=Vagococcus coleopterorum TaxID=2714946 RepID=A0A6G8ANU9_9ENTE|nr:30S ribosomal protein S1 [Vagococcus coleopterorum]QIL46605.1 30S ribosomal protein S1 [Vagococcus coleopterorum]
MTENNLDLTAQENAEMLNALESVQEVNVGDLVQGEVLVLEDKQAIVSILGTGVEGVIPVKELSAFPTDDISSLVKVGEILDLVVITSIGKDKENGSYLLSKRRLEAKKIWEQVEADFEAGKTVEGTVTDAVKGGLVVDLGVRGFVPASMIDVNFVSDFSIYKGQTLEFVVKEIEPSENRLILSRKDILAKDQAAKKAELMEKLVAGDIVKGKVARLTNFGAFIDLGGVDGLVHISEISHAHVSKAEDVLEVGQEVEAKILSIDTAKERISLSIKETVAGPWEKVSETFSEGDVVTGKIKRLTSFGAFVEIAPGVEGLVHISQISHQHVVTPHEVLKEGEEIQVKILEVSPADRRIALSIKALEEKPVEEGQVEEVEEDFEMPEAVSGFTLGDIVVDSVESTEE